MERPILMTTESVKAILDGRKTMTRRVIKPQPEYDASYIGGWVYKTKKQTMSIESFNEHRYTDIGCPYGQVGDRLWVREAWATEKCYNHLKPSDIPDTAKIYYVDKSIHSAGGYSLFTEMGKMRSSMFMCQWMSRITLDITGVRVERLQEITEDDAKIEGANPFLLDKLKGGTKYKMQKTYHHECYPLVSHADEGEEVVFECPNMGFARLHHTQWQEGQDPIFRIPAQEVFEYVGALEPDYKNGFRILWDSLNAKRGYGWDKNPWVWVVEFRRVA